MRIPILKRMSERLVRDDKSQSRLYALLKEGLVSQRKLYGIAVVAMVLVATTTAATAYLMESIVDAMTSTDDRARIFLVAVSVAAVFTIKGMATFVQLVAMARAGNRMVSVLQERIFSKLLTNGVGFFGMSDSSNLLTRLTQGAQGARGVIDIFVTSAARDVLMLIGLVGVMFYQQPFLSLISLVIGPVAIIGVRSLLGKVREIMKSQMTSMTEIIRVIQETSRGISVIKVFSLEDRMMGRMHNAVRQVEQRANSIARLQAITSPLMETLAGFAIAAVVALSALNMFGAQDTTPGQLMSFITALLMAYEPAKRLSRLRVQLESLMVTVNMMFALLDYTETLVEAPDARPMTRKGGRVSMRNIRFRYRQGANIFNGIHLEFEPRKTTALVGPSGGGKSTILNLVMRLYDPTSGRVMVDGQDLREVTFASLRERIAYVGQDTFLFSSSVMENIRVSRPDATDEEVLRAARDANAHEFIENLRKGYDTLVGENGAFLSGGQRQRISIARAILRNSDILLLDEATSALDSKSEGLVREALDRLTRNTTTIIIAHRLSTVLDADKVYVLEGGNVVEQGSPEELLRSGGTFRSLFDQQVDSYHVAMEPQG